MSSRSGISGLMLVMFLAFGPVGARSQVTVSSLIGDHMVLQREMKIPVWGRGEPGEKVTVRFNDQTQAATVDADGSWDVEFPALKAGGPYEMTISSGKKVIAVRDILVGDVWLCSGQSNMWWPIKWSANAGEETTKGLDWEIRLYSVRRIGTPDPLPDPGGKWVTCTPTTVGEFSGVGYVFGKEIHKIIGVPIGLVKSAYGATCAENWMSSQVLMADPDYKPIFDRWKKTETTYYKIFSEYVKKYNLWKAQVEKAKADGSPAPLKPLAPQPNPCVNPWRPGGLYNAMVSPLANYPIKGVIWYQGEQNTDRSYQYRKLFPALIRNWRNTWHISNLPFIFVQLANYMKPPAKPGPSKWAELREAQARTLSVPNTAMVVTIDIGDANCIHPKDKEDVGKRLALAAQALVYGQKVIYSGPVFDSMNIEGNKIRIRFKFTSEGLTTKGSDTQVKGFAIAGADRKFVWAQARIDGTTVVVWNPQVSHPIAVRYAWADNPVCNLYNKSGLPAAPFRTDDWPGITANNR
jgi:sialate O-acetylesterase